MDAASLAERRNMARFFVEHRHVSWVLLVGVLVWGVFGYAMMPQRKDPEIPVRVAAVLCPWPGARAEKVEELVTRVIEQRVAENDKVERVESTSRTGMSVVTLKLRDEVAQTGEVLDDINLKLNALRNLPDGAGPVTFLKDFGDTATLMLTVASPRAGQAEAALRALQAGRILDGLRRDAPPGPRLAMVLVVPPTVPQAQVERKLGLFTRGLEGDGRFADVRSGSESGVVVVDAATAMAAGEFREFVREFASTGLHHAELNPDLWQPVVVSDTARLGEEMADQAGDKYTWRDLEAFTDTIARTLLGVPEVAKVTRWGVRPETVFLDYSQERLASYGIQPWRVRDAFSGRNIAPSGGVAEFGGRRVALEPTGEFSSERELQDTLLAGSLYLRDVVEIERGYETPADTVNRYTARDAQGRWTPGKAVTLAVTMRAGQQIGAFSDSVDKALEELRQRLPEDLTLARTSDQPRQVEESVSLFMRSLQEAVVLVVLVALIGFREWRSALLMALSIPVTLAMTFGMMHLLGIDLQQISIASLILALGLLVDDPVVAGDAIKRDLAAGKPRALAAWAGPTRLAKAILYATITNIVAYLPFLLLSGDKGRFLYSMPVVVACSLVSSRVVSMSFIPFLGYYLLRTRQDLPDPTRGFARLYHRLGGWLIDHRWKALAVSLVFLAGGFWTKSLLKPMFFPIDRSYLSYVDVILPEDAPADLTDQTTARVEKAILDAAADFGRTHAEFADPLKSLTTFIGAGGPRFWFSVTPELKKPNYAQILVETRDKRTTEFFCGPLQAALRATIPGARVDVRRLETGPPVGVPVQIRISGEDEATLRALAERLKAALRALPSADRVSDNWGGYRFTARLDIDPDKAALTGVSNQDVARSTSLAVNGLAVTSLREGRLSIPVVLRLRGEERARLEDVANLYVYPQASDHKVPLTQVANIGWTMESEAIARRNHYRTITVSCFPMPGVLPSQVVEAVRPALSALQADLPPGCSLVIGGEHEEQVKGFKELGMVMAVSVAMIYLALLFQFRNAVKPLLVFGAIPYGVAGALVSLALMGQPFGFMAFLGIASLIGVIVSHVIVLFDFIEERLQAGEPLRQAILDAGVLRLRPVLITVGATVTALFPLAASGGPLWEPLCYAQIGGLTVATFVTLLMVPVLYAIAAFDLKAFGKMR
ncbi:Cobalt-zinc-cadmium resistance protein CzcA [Fundidesulfovibrio magnetotacticus]|uniref:Cobalt-zinc-cadmium resistance protein CzcA n=1 Tax=Fundidesulfovibrio magnetotacticus TaxID=2730080 RepID=A0A6V8LVW9_9BACT|nr:efflux RND transporter permease subunit [Fundidesulfovibrio magnetotacticus]GFK94741.1 Cobalt-zinc-cadmium resistance protein CzcA [Fundidesulfovibrio magnetotacticus]